MKLTQEMINNAFELIHQIYGDGTNQSQLFDNYNPYVASWFSAAIERIYGIEIRYTKQELQTWKIHTIRKEKLKKLNE